MKTENRALTGWGNFPVINTQVAEPESVAETAAFVREREAALIARGNGRSYGDAALGSCVLSMLGLNRILAFDAATGEIACEAGVLLDDILKLTLPHGWFFHVTPGTRFVTVGGAIAADVHGKNHLSAGCFSNWLISMELMNGDGQILTCSPTENAALFWQTCGGMGWTGVILSARFRLRKIPSNTVLQTTTRAENLEKTFAAFESAADHEYNAAWLDCTARGAGFGRGVLLSGDHWPGEDGVNFPKIENTRLRDIPFFAPNWLLNPLLIRAHNTWFWLKKCPETQQIGLEKYFFPLDRLQNWNRLYGRRGFVQYQFCLPESAAPEGIARVLETVQAGRDLPFLSVLKRHGERPAQAVHSFPVRGYSLALDFPRTATVPGLVGKLDEVVWRFGGKIYLAKDACSAPKMSRIRPASFGETKFSSLQKQRIS